VSRFWKEFKKMWFVWIGLLLVVIFVGRSAFFVFDRWQTLQNELAERENDIELREQSIANLSVQLEQSVDPHAIEKLARQTLNLQREGEGVFIVIGAEDVAREENFSSQAAPIGETSAVWLNIKAWYNYFFQK
jgi:hypothetical protein